MTTTDWIIDVALILIVVRQLRAERLRAFVVLLPLGICAFVASHYLKTVPTAGNDLLLVGGFLVLGAALGLAGGMLTRVTTRGGDVYLQARFGAASLWVTSMTARLLFIIWISSDSGAESLARFSGHHDITSSDAWQDALVLMALAEVVVRMGTIVVRGVRLGRAAQSVPAVVREGSLPQVPAGR